ncbi:MAG: DUF3592 domain-containing protein [Clostridia bacterium]|nr:DUF3592 domain-containing protein [Clostridia bacterium]
MKKLVIILWIAFVVCVIATVGLWFAMNNSNPEFEEVKAIVTSSETKQVVNKKTGSRTNFYEVKVRYEGKEYELKNPHNTYMYPEGKTVTAYLANDKLYANEEGVKTATPVAIVYFVCLFGSFGLLMAAAMVTSKNAQNKRLKEE